LTIYPYWVYSEFIIVKNVNIKKYMRKNTIIQRLNIITGQINGLANLIEKNDDCRKVTEQFYAVNSGLKKAMELYFKTNMTSCLRSINLKKRRMVEFLLKEIVKNK